MIKLSIVLAGLIALTGCVSKMPPQASGDAELASLVVYFMQPDELGRHELHAVHGDSNHFGYSQDPTTGKIDFFVVVESIRTRANMWMASRPVPTPTTVLAWLKTMSHAYASLLKRRTD